MSDPTAAIDGDGNPAPGMPAVWRWSARSQCFVALVAAPRSLAPGWWPADRRGLSDWLAALPATAAAALHTWWQQAASGRAVPALAWPPAGPAEGDVGGAWLQARPRCRRDGRLIELVLTAQSRQQAPADGTERAAAAAEALRQRRAYTAMVSHELRTPLNAVTGFCALARGESGDMPLRAALTQIDDAAQLMRRVIDDLIDLERLAAGKLALQPDQRLSLAGLLSRVGGLAAGLAGAPALRLYTAADDALPDALCGDGHRLEQVLLNLVANAVRHTDSGMVLLAARSQGRVTEGEAGGHWRVRFMVADTGVGMAPDDVVRVMQPYEQAGDDAARRRGGSGLGLAVVQQLLALHDSRLQVASVAGGGTLVWFDLLLAPAVGVQALAEPPCTALVCSDDPRLQHSLQLQWRAQGQRLRPVRLADVQRLAGVLLGGVGHLLIDVATPDHAALLAAAQAAGLRPWCVSALPVPLADRQQAYLSGVPLLHAPVAARSVLASQAPPPPAWADAGPSRQAALAADAPLVLVVEDNPLNQQVLEGLLRQQGLRVCMAGTLAQARQLLRTQPVALALLDGALPDGDGFSLARWLRRQPRSVGLPLAFVTAHVDPEREAAAAALGALDCLLKPIELDRLRAVLQRAGLQPGVPPAGAALAPPTLPDLTPQFIAQRPQLLAPIAAALASNDAGPLQRAVHALRGALAWLPGGPARQAAALAREVETALLAGQPLSALPLQALLAQVAAIAPFGQVAAAPAAGPTPAPAEALHSG